MALHPRGPNMKKAQFKKKISTATRAKNLFHEALHLNCEIHGSWFFDSAKLPRYMKPLVRYNTVSSINFILVLAARNLTSVAWYYASVLMLY